MKMYLLTIIIICICLLASAEFCSCNNNDTTTTCPVKHCNNNYGPEIRFPFSLKGKKYPNQCVYPRDGFELYCSDNGNLTLLHIPFPSLNSSSFNLANLPPSVELIVQRIDYASQSIYLSVADAHCSDGYALLNLSATPFEQQPTTDYTFFNCSPSSLSMYNMYHFPCLGGSSNNSVYWIESDSNLYLAASSCTKMFNILSSGYPLFAENIQLDWNMPNCGVCERKGGACRLKNNGTTLETECVHPGSSKKKVIKGLQISLSTIVALLMALFIVHIFNKKKDKKKMKQFLEDHRALRPTRFSYADIKKITSHFKEKLGQGGYGTVYKGKLSTDILIAVKVLDNFKGNGEEFINEVRTIGKIHHVNVVRLIGYCADGYRRCLVYEFLPNESLQKLISSENQIRVLGWEKLQQIAIRDGNGTDELGYPGQPSRLKPFKSRPVKNPERERNE